MTRDWGAWSPPLRAGDTKPPPWPPVPDPRTPECRHDWDTGGAWGRVGERQRRCNHCDRWIWEREHWPEEGGT